MKRTEYEECRADAITYLQNAGIALTDAEKNNIEVADFGLGNIRNIGLEILTYINTSRVCAKEMVLFPGQMCPEHRHVPTGGSDGKEETFRCRAGTVYLYVSGTQNRKFTEDMYPPTDVTVFHEIILTPGEQYTILPGTLHWFRGGTAGAVVSEFSTHSTDETDLFTDKKITRLPVIE